MLSCHRPPGARRGYAWNGRRFRRAARRGRRHVCVLFWLSMAKRIFLFVVTNIVVVATLSIIASILGIGRYTGGTDLGGLMVFCLFWGMGGAFISLEMSRWIAKRMTGMHLVDGRTGRQ